MWWDHKWASTQQPMNDCLVTRKCNQLIRYRFLNRARMIVLFQSWRDGLCACRSVSISHWPLGNLPCNDNLVHSAMTVSKINITVKSFINVYTYFQILKCFLYTSWNICVKWFEDILQTWDKKGYRITKIKVYAAICWINLLRGILIQNVFVFLPSLNMGQECPIQRNLYCQVKKIIIKIGISYI